MLDTVHTDISVCFIVCCGWLFNLILRMVVSQFNSYAVDGCSILFHLISTRAYQICVVM